jgi:hypothetical protein
MNEIITNCFYNDNIYQIVEMFFYILGLITMFTGAKIVSVHYDCPPPNHLYKTLSILLLGGLFLSTPIITNNFFDKNTCSLSKEIVYFDK